MKKTPMSVKLLSGLALFAMAFDFKGDSGGSISQYVMVLICIFAALPLTSSWLMRKTNSGRRFFALALAITCLGMAVSLFEGISLYFSGRVVVNYCLLLLGMGIAGALEPYEDGATFLTQMITCVAAVSTGFSYYYGTQIGGVDIQEARYQIVSPVVVTLIAYVVAQFLSMRKFSPISMVLTALASIPILLSVTRSFVVTGGFVIVGCIIFQRALAVGNPAFRQFWKVKSKSMVIAAIGLMLSVAVAVALRPDVIATWRQRTSENSLITGDFGDITFITRAAEALGIWESVTATKLGPFVGRGFGNVYHWSLYYQSELDAIDRNELSSYGEVWFPSHSTFTYALFFGGLIALVWQLYAYWHPLREGYRAMKSSSRWATPTEIQCLLFGIVSVWVYLSQSLTSNPLGGRLPSLFLGAAMMQAIFMARHLQRKAAFIRRNDKVVAETITNARPSV